MRYELIKEHVLFYKINNLCNAMLVSKSGYYAYIKRLPNEKKEELKTNIAKCYSGHKSRIGAPKVYYHMKELGFSVSMSTIARYMRSMGLMAKNRAKFRHGLNKNKPNVPNILERNFAAKKPNEKWVSDITYIKTNKGWCYVCTVLDLYSRKVIAYDFSSKMDTDILVNAFNKAIQARKGAKLDGLIFHSDQGSQYSSNVFSELLQKNKITQSMSRRGNCWDNSVAESFFKSLKTEADIYENMTFEQVKQELFEYIVVYYNNMRLHSTLGYKTPNQFEASNIN
jgi:transposase InsO family protein